jgi:hypothetical protein
MAGVFRWFEVLLCSGAICASLTVPSAAAERQPWMAQACVVGTASTPAAGKPAAASQGEDGSGIVAQISLGLTPDGSAFFHAVSGDLDVTKRVSRAGTYALRLARGQDAVEIRADRAAVTVSRGGQSVQVDLATAGEDDLAAVRLLLAGSRSVRGLRVLAAAMGSGATRSPGALAVLLADAMVGVLDGDVGAVLRLAERIGSRGPAVRRVSAEQGCYERWEAEVIRAYDSYLECIVQHLGVTQWADACGLRWLLWVESAWFSFLACSGSPFRIQQ